MSENSANDDNERFVGIASGRELDRIGRLVDVQRKEDETDGCFRQRVIDAHQMVDSDE